MMSRLIMNELLEKPLGEDQRHTGIEAASLAETEGGAKSGDAPDD
jgi:hypothetical protein